MAAIDIGDPLPNLSVRVENPPGTPVDVGAMTLTMTLPDGTTTPVTPTRTDVGTWSATYIATMAGLHVATWVATGANASVKVQYRSVGDPVDISDVRSSLKVAGVTSDDVLYLCIAAAVDALELRTGRTLRTRTVVDVKPGGKYAVPLSSVPVQSVTSVVDNGVTLAPSDYTLNGRTGLLYRGSGSGSQVFAGGPAGVVVTYVAGPAVVDSNDRLAVVEMTRFLVSRFRGSSGQPSAGDVADAFEVVRQLVGPRMPRFGS